MTKKSLVHSIYMLSIDIRQVALSERLLSELPLNQDQQTLYTFQPVEAAFSFAVTQLYQVGLK